MNAEPKINKKITYGIVAVLLIVLVTIGATYAYFSAQAETDVQTVTTGTLTMGFETGDTLNLTGLTPIKDSEIKSKAAEIPFSVTNTGIEHMNITIKLKDITIADDLKDVDFRWGLYNADTDKGISFGIFKYASNGGEEILYRDSIIDAGSAAKNYVLRIWIHDDGAEQNYMQGETFSGKIEVTGTAIEYTDESCFVFDSNTGNIDGYDEATCGTDVVIPRTIGGVAVTKLSVTNGGGHLGYKGLTSVIIPDSVTELGGVVFYGNNLTHITVPESITSSVAEPFEGNPLTSIFIPEGIVDIGGLSMTGTLVMPQNVMSGLSSNVKDLVLMEGVTSIYLGTVNESLTSIEIPRTVTSIADRALSGKTNLEKIVVRGKTEAEAKSTFGENWNCKILTDTCEEYRNVEYRP